MDICSVVEKYFQLSFRQSDWFTNLQQVFWVVLWAKKSSKLNLCRTIRYYLLRPGALSIARDSWPTANPFQEGQDAEEERSAPNVVKGPWLGAVKPVQTINEQ